MVSLMFYFICRSYGDPVHCRKALHRAVQCTSDYPEHVCEVLLTFERVEGEPSVKLPSYIKIEMIFMNYTVSVFCVFTYRLSGGLGHGSAEDGDPDEQD